MGFLTRVRRKVLGNTARETLFVALLTTAIIAGVKEKQVMAGKNSKKATRRVTPPEGETPSGAFRRLAMGRTNKAVKAISLLSQLTGSAYESTDAEKRAIITALEVSVEQVKEVFAGKAKASDKFRLPE